MKAKMLSIVLCVISAFPKTSLAADDALMVYHEEGSATYISDLIPQALENELSKCIYEQDNISITLKSYPSVSEAESDMSNMKLVYEASDLRLYVYKSDDEPQRASDDYEGESLTVHIES